MRLRDCLPGDEADTVFGYLLGSRMAKEAGQQLERFGAQ